MSNNRRQHQRAGFSLIELIVSVVLAAIIFYSLISIFITAGTRGVMVETFTVAQSLAEGKLEEALSRDFFAISSESESKFPADLGAYTYEYSISYVSAEALDAPAAVETDYKMIGVKVRHPLLKNPVELSAVRSRY